MTRTLTLPATRVVHGPGAVATLGDELAALGVTRPLVVASGTLARDSDLLDGVRAAPDLAVADMVTDICQHVPRASVLRTAARYRAARADGLVSVGGGTQIDAAKGVALCIAEGVDTADALAEYRMRRDQSRRRVVPALTGTPPAHIAISTTLSGAEFTGIVGITDPARGIKDVYHSGALQPDAAILDPAATAYTPAWLWAASGLRAVDHVVEGVCSPRHSLVADASLLAALRILAADLLASAQAPENHAARERCQLAAWMAILHLPNVAMGLSHAIGHQLGARFDIPHGVTSCLTLPAVMAFNLPAVTDRLALLAEPLAAEVPVDADDEARAHAATGAVRQLIADMPVPTRLRDVGVSEHDLRWLAEASLADLSAEGTPRPADRDDIEALLRTAW